MNVNKQGQDWLLIKEKLRDTIVTAHSVIESGVMDHEYNFWRGQIAVARELIEWVEPTTPPETVEDSYGISNPDEQE